MSGLNQLNRAETPKTTPKTIKNMEEKDSFPTPDMLDEEGKIDKKKTAEKAERTIEEATKEKNAAEKENKPNIFQKIGNFFSGIFNKSPETRTTPDKIAAQEYKKTQQQLAQESQQLLPKFHHEHAEKIAT
jgi:hypothetical protein